MAYSLEDSTQLTALANQVRYSTGVSGSLSVSDMENALLNRSNFATVSTITIQSGDTDFLPPASDRYVLLCTAEVNNVQSNWIFLKGQGFDVDGMNQGQDGFFTIDSSGVSTAVSGPFHWYSATSKYVIDATSISNITAFVFHENGV